MEVGLFKQLYRIYDGLLGRLALINVTADTEIWLEIGNLLSELDDFIYSRTDEDLATLENAVQVAIDNPDIDNIERVLQQLEEIGIGYQGR